MTFLSKLKSQLQPLEYVHLLMGGDFNIIFNINLDKLAGDMVNGTNQYTNELLNFMETHDVLRLVYPDKKIFTIEDQKGILQESNRFYNDLYTEPKLENNIK